MNNDDLKNKFKNCFGETVFEGIRIFNIERKSNYFEGKCFTTPLELQKLIDSYFVETIEATLEAKVKINIKDNEIIFDRYGYGKGYFKYLPLGDVYFGPQIKLPLKAAKEFFQPFKERSKDHES